MKPRFDNLIWLGKTEDMARIAADGRCLDHGNPSIEWAIVEIYKYDDKYDWAEWESGEEDCDRIREFYGLSPLEIQVLLMERWP